MNRIRSNEKQHLTFHAGADSRTWKWYWQARREPDQAYSIWYVHDLNVF